MVEDETTLEWNPDDAKDVERARESFARLKDQGYEFYEVVSARGTRVKDFDPKARKLIAALGGKSRTDKVRGTRPRAMAGGPTAVRGSW